MYSRDFLSQPRLQKPVSFSAPHVLCNPKFMLHVMASESKIPQADAVSVSPPLSPSELHPWKASTSSLV